MGFDSAVARVAEQPTKQNSPLHKELLRMHLEVRAGRPRQEALSPIEGSPPDLASVLEGCPFAPRCGWRLDTCWVNDPPLDLADGERRADALITQHQVACHNQPTRIETVDGVPLREGFAPAPPPGFVAEVLVEEGITEGVDL